MRKTYVATLVLTTQRGREFLSDYTIEDVTRREAIEIATQKARYYVEELGYESCVVDMISERSTIEW